VCRMQTGETPCTTNLTSQRAVEPNNEDNSDMTTDENVEGVFSVCELAGAAENSGVTTATVVSAGTARAQTFSKRRI
jgi:hypothetical protein